MEFLPTADRCLFVNEFARVVTAVAESDNYAPVSQLVREWRATAEAHADPRLAARLRAPIAARGVSMLRPAG